MGLGAGRIGHVLQGTAQEGQEEGNKVAGQRLCDQVVVGLATEHAIERFAGQRCDQPAFLHGGFDSADAIHCSETVNAYLKSKNKIINKAKLRKTLKTFYQQIDKFSDFESSKNRIQKSDSKIGPKNDNDKVGQDAILPQIEALNWRKLFKKVENSRK